MDPLKRSLSGWKKTGTGSIRSPQLQTGIYSGTLAVSPFGRSAKKRALPGGFLRNRNGLRARFALAGE
ncbi:hypothetical protein GCM10027299_44090 [Larkinella ripae]